MENIITLKLKDIFSILKKNNSPFKNKTLDEKLEYLYRLDYTIVIKQKKKKFYLIIPELCLISESSKLDNAFKNLIEKKQNFFVKTLECEAEDEIQLPRKNQSTKTTFQNLKLFIYKLLILCFFSGLTITVSGAFLSNKIGDVTSDLPNLIIDISKQLFKKTGNIIINTPKELQDERIRKFQELIKGLDPFIQELQSFSTPPYKD